MSGIVWRDIECTLIEWAAPILDLDECRFIWENQNIPQPAYPYLTFRRDSLIRSGGADEQRTSTDLSQPEGEEVAIETVGIREFTLTVKALVDEETGSTDPDCDAVALLTQLQNSLSQQSVLDALCLGGLSVVQELAVVDLSQVVNGRFISRAALDIRFRTASSCIERTGYINTARVRSVPCNPSGPCDVTGVDFEVSGN